ncbi:MAG: hypothetical protein AAF560_27855 [Acidobacteriota bacterium]
MTLAGTWQLHHQWGEHGYNITAKFGADGSITVKGGFFGTWTVLGTSNQVALAIANFDRGSQFFGSVTSYAGNVSGGVMGGQMKGGKRGGTISQGTWHGIRRSILKAPKEAHQVPD